MFRAARRQRLLGPLSPSHGVISTSGSKAKAPRDSSDPDSSSDSDSGNGNGAAAKTEKAEKSDKRYAKDANSLVEDIGNEVSLPRALDKVCV